MSISKGAWIDTLEHLPSYASWSAGYGVIRHTEQTRRRVLELVAGRTGQSEAKAEEMFAILAAADRLASAGMWLVVHMTYANRVDLSGAPLQADDFKPDPQGHTGGALNIVPAYAGYLAANILTGTTRSWLMGQGHCVAAIEALNALVDNLSAEQRLRYAFGEEGLSQLARDFYSYAIHPDGTPGVPLGSHVNVHTAGGISEGGYLGFAEVQYAHMPLRGESLAVFLSDGAFEEQRGSDWSPRWWRASDSGAIMPIMVLNGRRIDQRTSIAQKGGTQWLLRHLELNGFDPFEIDGHDPAAYAWAIIDMEDRLTALQAKADDELDYPVRIPHAIAKCIKGFGFPGAGTNRAHNLPLEDNPRNDDAARDEFNQGAVRLFVPPGELDEVRRRFSCHQEQGRVREAHHPLAERNIDTPVLPTPSWNVDEKAMVSPMQAIDAYFVDMIDANPRLRVRVGNPDELSSNRMDATLARLKHRASNPEPGGSEAVDGAVITALNEEAVIGAALGNKAGLNLAVSYEAFAVKMLGALRQDILFARHQRQAGRDPRWLGVPLLLTSHTWENGKNEQSHQDPTLCEALLGEMSDTSRVLFPVDANSAVAALQEVYRSHGVIAALVVPKQPVPHCFGPDQAFAACRTGAAHLRMPSARPPVQLVAVGAYQLRESMRAARRLADRGCEAMVTCIIEPGRLRIPRDELEARFVIPDAPLAELFPADLPRVLVSHSRPEPLLGVLRRLDEGPRRLRALGYINRGGTLDVDGMLFANRCTWAHIALAAAEMSGGDAQDFLTENELNAVRSRGRLEDLYC